MKKHTPLLLLFSLCAGLLAALPLIKDGIAWLSFLLFIPYLLFLYTLPPKTTLRFYYASGLFFFLGYYMAAFSFFIAMYPLDFAGLDTVGSVAVIFAAMVLLPLFQAWFSAFAILLLGVLRKRSFFRTPLFFSLSVAALYTVFAYAQTFTWAGVPWANTAVGIASSPLLIQGASLLGSNFLIFVIIFVNAALAEGFVLFRECRNKESLLCVMAACVLLVSQLLFGAVRLAIGHHEERSMTVALVQGSAPATEGISVPVHLYTCRNEALAAAENADIDLMLWSESVITDDLRGSKKNQAFFSAIAKRTGAIQAVGAFSSEPKPDGSEGYYNSIFLFYPDGTMSEETYKKRRPVPFGEYVPMPWLFEALIPALTEISMLSRNTTPGEGSALLEAEEGTLGGLICFDSIYPALARESTKDGAEILLLTTDDSWFDGSFGKSLHFRHAALRAVENGRYVVRTGNTGQSGVINSMGETVYTIPMDVEAHGISTVQLRDNTTVYTAVGEIFPYLCIGFLILAPIMDAKKKENKEE